MNLQPVNPNISAYPKELQTLLSGTSLYDSSCSPNASVTFVDKDGGYFLKSAPKGALAKEAEMTRYFHKKGLSANVLAYISNEKDWLLTEKIQGDDCTAAKYLEQPERLCDILAERLVMLHNTDFADCPIQNHTKRYIAGAKKNFHSGIYDISLFPDNWGYATAADAYRVIETRGHLLETNTLLHGDYCLPNIILDNWSFSGFVDLDSGGVGDRHVDIFWGIWTLEFNLKTKKYRERFIDAYGRGNVDEERLRIVAAAEVFG